MKPVKIAIGVILALAVSASAGSLRAEEGGERLDVEDCLALAKKYAGKLNGNDKYLTYEYIAKTYLWVDQYDEVVTFVNLPETNELFARLPGRNSRSLMLLWLARESADKGRYDFAIKYAREIRDPVWRDNALYGVVMIACQHYDFNQAFSARAMLIDDSGKEQASEDIINAQIRAGKYEDAETTFKTFPSTYNKYSFQELLEKAQKKGMAYPRINPPTTIMERTRQDIHSSPSWEYDMVRISRAEGRNFRIGNACQRTQIAWVLYLENDIPECRNVLWQAYNIIEEENDISKIWAAVRICDLALECNEKAIYLKICEKYFLGDRLVGDYLATLHKTWPELSSFNDHPRIITVLARLQQIPLAIEFLNKSAEYYGNISFAESWWVLGYACALTGQIDVLRQHSREIKADWQKSVLYSGMAAGLYERGKKR